MIRVVHVYVDNGIKSEDKVTKFYNERYAIDYFNELKDAAVKRWNAFSDFSSMDVHTTVRENYYSACDMENVDTTYEIIEIYTV